MITCQDILELQLDGVELIAGEKGLTRPVTWTYMVQTRPFEEHMNQGNFALCVVDYVRFDLEEAGKAMEELYGLGISGFGISITDDKEPVPKEMIDKANALQLPLFYIRWKGASFVDIAQSVGKIILEYEMQNRRMGDYFDLSFEETVRRHNTRNREFGEKDMRRWWREKDFSSSLREQAITCEMDTDSIVEKIYSDLNADRKAIAFMSI